MKKKFKDPNTQNVFEKLVARAAKIRKVIAYQTLGEQTGLPYEHDHLGKYMAEINEYTLRKYGILLSSIVINQQTGLPGPKFPEWAWDHGIRIDSPLWYKKHWAKIWKVFKHHETKKNH